MLWDFIGFVQRLNKQVYQKVRYTANVIKSNKIYIYIYLTFIIFYEYY